MELSDTFRAFERENFGTQFLTDKQLAALVKMAVAQNQVNNAVWLKKQMAVYAAQRQNPQPRAGATASPAAPIAEEPVNYSKFAAMTARHAEITIKINEIPPATVVQGKRVGFAVKAGEETYLVVMPEKVMNRALEEMMKAEQWVAAIKGKRSATLPEGIILENPSIQVFAKKPES